MPKARLGDPAEDALPVTPSDTNDLPNGPCRALVVGGAGSLSVVTLAGEVRNLLGIPVGVLPLQVRRVRATGTVASNLTALY
jgi:hypothetical protein